MKGHPMSVPDFERAEYAEPRVIQGEVVGQPRMERGAPALAIALAYGAGAAVAGSIGYGLVSMTGFMVSIVAIGIAWLIAKAMMTATRGVGGRPYQIAAVILTYLAVTWGELLGIVWRLPAGRSSLLMVLNPKMWWIALTFPYLELEHGFNGIMGVVILGIGLLAAWRYAAGGPGFGAGGGRRITPFG
jgi:hypothetical protein